MDIRNLDHKKLSKQLRDARRRRKLTLRDVSYETRISCKILQAFESGSPENYPPAAYAKNLLQKYASFLRVDLRYALAAIDTDFCAIADDPLLHVPEENTEEVSNPFLPQHKNASMNSAQDTEAEQVSRFAFLQPVLVLTLSALFVALIGLVYQQLEADLSSEKPTLEEQQSAQDYSEPTSPLTLVEPPLDPQATELLN